LPLEDLLGIGLGLGENEGDEIEINNELSFLENDETRQIGLRTRTVSLTILEQTPGAILIERFFQITQVSKNPSKTQPL